MRDAIANDSDKTFTVPTGKIVRPLYIRVQIATSADAGNRILQVRMTNGTDGIWAGPLSANIAANLQGVLMMAPGQAYSTGLQEATQDTQYTCNVAVLANLPEMYLLAGYVINFVEANAVAVGADDMTVTMCYVEYDA
jgi:hypothetical protein